MAVDAIGVTFTVIGAVAGVAAAYFAWLAVRKPRTRAAIPKVTDSKLGESMGSAAFAYDVFISYSHADLDWVVEFAGHLESKGHRVARDEVVMKPGDIIVHAVEEAIRDSAHGILVFSAASVASRWVKEEYASLMQRSIEEGPRFIPVIIDDVKLPLFAASRYYVDFRNVDTSEYDKLVVKISEALRT
jgi:TIR domain